MIIKTHIIIGKHEPLLWQKHYHETMSANRSDQSVGLLGDDFSNIWKASLISSSLTTVK